jgi:hypothetical protein
MELEKYKQMVSSVWPPLNSNCFYLCNACAIEVLSFKQEKDHEKQRHFEVKRLDALEQIVLTIVKVIYILSYLIKKAVSKAFMNLLMRQLF